MKLVSLKVFIVSLLCFNFSVKAQENVNFQWSKFYEYQGIGLQNPVMSLASNKGFVVYSVEAIPNKTFGKHIYITAFNNKCLETNQLKIALPVIEGKEAIYLKTIEANNQLHIFYYLPVKGKSNELLVQTYTFGTDALSTPKKIVSFPIEKLSNSGDFMIAISEDNQTIGVVAHWPKVKKSNEQLSYHVFDATLTELSKKDFTLNYISKKAYDENLYVTNNKKGLLVKLLDKNKTKPTTIMVELATNEDLVETPLPSDDFFVIDSKIVETPNGPMMVGFATDLWKGAIANTDRKSKFAFLYAINTKKMLAKHTWTKDILKKFLGKGFTNLTVKDVLVHQENIYLIGDRYREDATLIPEKSFEYDYRYFNGPGVVVKFQLDGTVDYNSYYKYNEEYVNQHQEKASFTPVIIDNQLNLFGNIDLAYLSEKLIVVFKQGYTLNRISFDNEGQQTQVPIYDTVVGGKKSAFNFCPSTLIKANDNTFYMKSYSTSNQGFGKMILNN